MGRKTSQQGRMHLLVRGVLNLQKICCDSIRPPVVLSEFFNLYGWEKSFIASSSEKSTLPLELVTSSYHQKKACMALWISQLRRQPV